LTDAARLKPTSSEQLNARPAKMCANEGDSKVRSERPTRSRKVGEIQPLEVWSVGGCWWITASHFTNCISQPFPVSRVSCRVQLGHTRVRCSNPVEILSLYLSRSAFSQEDVRCPCGQALYQPQHDLVYKSTIPCQNTTNVFAAAQNVPVHAWSWRRSHP
jgi:hypothetical protein